MSDTCNPTPTACRRGFTLIEVIGAIVIFSVGVLVAAQLSGVLSTQIERSALRSKVVFEGQERMDSVSAMAYGDLSAGTTTDTLLVHSISHELIIDITSASSRAYQIDVSLTALDGTGPAYSATSYVFERW